MAVEDDLLAIINNELVLMMNLHVQNIIRSLLFIGRHCNLPDELYDNLSRALWLLSYKGEEVSEYPSTKTLLIIVVKTATYEFIHLHGSKSIVDSKERKNPSKIAPRSQKIMKSMQNRRFFTVF